MNKLFYSLVAAPAALASPLYATTYFTILQAQAQMFPRQVLRAQPVQLTPEQISAIRKASGESPLSKDVKAWRAPDGGWFIVDQVVGKHEFITYAVALTAQGAVRDVEILDYRETYGGEVRNPKWREQFLDKRFGAPLQLGKDIKNISGATLSSKHITDGVRRLLATYAIVLAHA